MNILVRLVLTGGICGFCFPACLYPPVKLLEPFGLIIKYAFTKHFPEFRVLY